MISCGFFDAENFTPTQIQGETVYVPDRAYSPSDMNTYFDGIIASTGAFYNYPIGTKASPLKVVGVAPTDYTEEDTRDHPGMMKAFLTQGLARIKGHFVRVVSDEVLYFDPGSADGDRVDRVVLRLNKANRIISAVIIKGTPGSTKEPGLIRTDDIYDISIARCIVQQTYTNQNAKLQFIPEVGTSTCPWITHLVYGSEDQKNIMARLDDWLTAYGESIQDWLDTLIDDLEVSTTIVQFQAIVSSGLSWNLETLISDYTFNRGDVFNIFYNGLRLNSNEYTLSNEGVLTLNHTIPENQGNELYIQILKSQVGVPSYVNGDLIEY